MKATEISKYDKYGCGFSGKLVIVEYFEDMEKDPHWGVWNSGVVYEYIEKAQALVKEQYGDCEELLSIPEYVVRIKA